MRTSPELIFFAPLHLSSLEIDLGSLALPRLPLYCVALRKKFKDQRPKPKTLSQYTNSLLKEPLSCPVQLDNRPHNYFSKP
jgi:hypothetical protein